MQCAACDDGCFEGNEKTNKDIDGTADAMGEEEGKRGGE